MTAVPGLPLALGGETINSVAGRQAGDDGGRLPFNRRGAALATDLTVI